MKIKLNIGGNKYILLEPINNNEIHISIIDQIGFRIHHTILSTNDLSDMKDNLLMLCSYMENI